MRIVIYTCVLLMLASCGGRKLEVMKSPCAGAEGSPCGPKRPVNEWMHQPSGDSNATV